MITYAVPVTVLRDYAKVPRPSVLQSPSMEPLPAPVTPARELPLRWKMVERWMADARVSVPLLYAIFFAAAITLVLAATSQGLLTKEEASSAFVNPTFLQFHLQHHVFGTNFYGYVYFWLANHIVEGLFYGRFAKAAVMALLPCFIYLYLRKGFQFGGLPAFAAALGVSVLPGIICFSWLGVDMGIETPIGWCALWLALFDSPAAIVASSFFAALSAECYGAGVVFLIAVAASHWFRFHRSRRMALAAGFGLMLAVLLFPVFWWTNVQTLLTGGAGDPTIHGSRERLVSLGTELFLRGDSYYFFSNGAPALGAAIIGLLAIAGLIAVIVRDARRAWPLILICVTSIGIYAAAGNVIGVRRVIPLVVSLAVFACLLLRSLAASSVLFVRAAAYISMAVWITVAANDFLAVRQGLASARIQLPQDFEFRVPPGQTMASTISGLLDGSFRMPQDLAGYEPDRTLSILYVLGKTAPRYSPHELILRCDAHGWSIPSNAPRFVRIRRHFSKPTPP